MLASLLRDSAYAVRTLGRKPAFSVAAVLTLALGIGATTGMYTVADAVLMAPLAYPSPERLLFVSSGFPGSSSGGDQLSWRDIEEIAARNRTLEGIAAYNTGRALQMRTGGSGEPERVRANLVAPAYLALLGARAARGRLLGADDNRAANAHPVAVITHDFWRRRLDANPAVVGQTLTLSDVPLTIVGVLDSTFRDVSAEEGYAFASDVFIPAMMSPSFGGATYLTDRNARNFWGLARLKPGVTVEQAKEDIAAIGLQLQREHQATNRGFTFWAERLDSYLSKDVRGPIVLLLAGSAFVLLIGCANVANLLLTHTSGRTRELAVRVAVGAGRSHIVSLLFAESLTIAAVGGLAGLTIASISGPVFKRLVPGELTPRLEAAGLDTAALAFAAALTMGVALALAVVSALRVPADPAVDVLRSGRGSTGHGSRARTLLLVMEVATAVVLVIGAGLMLDSLARLRRTHPGFRTERLVTAAMDLRAARYANDAAAARFGVDLVRTLRAVPGVEAAMIWGPARPGRQTWVSFPGREDVSPAAAERLMTWRHNVNPGALRDIGIPLLTGRDFSEHDTAGRPLVAIVSQTLARTLWPEGDAVGKRFRARADVAGSPLITVVGVAADVKHRGRLNDLLYPARDVYFPHAQRPDRMVIALVRSTSDPAAVVPGVRAAVRRLDPELPLFDIATFADHLAEEEAETRFAAIMMTAYGVVALLLAAIGIYGVLSYSVTMRTREMAVRMALGATRAAVVKSVVGNGMRPALMGVVIGLGAAAALTRFIASLLFGVAPRDPVTFAGVAAVLTAVALGATLIPARRATRVRPMDALRAE